MNANAQAELQALARDFRIAKAKGVKQTHREALALATASRLQLSLSDTAPGMLAEVMIQTLQKHLLPVVVRRDNSSVDYQGVRLNAALPTYTEVLVNIRGPEGELAALKKTLSEKGFTAEELGVSDSIEIRLSFLLNVIQTQHFYCIERLKNAFSSTVSLENYTLEVLNSEGDIKVKCLLYMLRTIITAGVEGLVAMEYRGKTDTILTPEAMGPGNFSPHYHAKPILSHERLRSRPKSVVYTSFSKFHEFLLKVCSSLQLYFST